MTQTKRHLHGSCYLIQYVPHNIRERFSAHPQVISRLYDKARGTPLLYQLFLRWCPNEPSLNMCVCTAEDGDEPWRVISTIWHNISLYRHALRSWNDAQNEKMLAHSVKQSQFLIKQIAKIHTPLSIRVFQFVCEQPHQNARIIAKTVLAAGSSTE